jgi:hypothetical protein
VILKKEVVNQAIPLLAQYLVEYKSVLQDKTIPEEIEQMRKEIEEIENNPGKIDVVFLDESHPQFPGEERMFTSYRQKKVKIIRNFY